MKNITFLGCLLLVSAFAKAQDLNTLIEEAMTNNPEIQAFELRYKIASEKVNEVNSLPNTEMSAGYFASEPETRTGAQKARFSVKQIVPWFGTITARENYANSMADADYLEIAIAQRKLTLSVAQTYYSLYGLTAKQAVLEENIQLLKTYERLALTSVEVGKASAVDVLKLQIRQNELQQQQEMLEQEILAEQAKFNNLLHRDASTAILVEEIELPEEDTLLSPEGLTLNPELVKYDKLYASIDQAELLNLKERGANLGIGLDYIPVAERTDMNVEDNGKDIVMPMISVSIPIFNNKYKSVTQQNSLRKQQLDAERENRLDRLKTMFTQAEKMRTSARIQYRTQQKNLRYAKDAEEILIKNYETGTIDFNDVLDIQELQLKFETQQIEAIKNYYLQSAIIHYLITQ